MRRAKMGRGGAQEMLEDPDEAEKKDKKSDPPPLDEGDIAILKHYGKGPPARPRPRRRRRRVPSGTDTRLPSPGSAQACTSSPSRSWRRTSRTW